MHPPSDSSPQSVLPLPHADLHPCFFSLPSPTPAPGHLLGHGPHLRAGGRQRSRLGRRAPLPLEHVALQHPAAHGPPRPLDLPPHQGPLGLSGRRRAEPVCPSIRRRLPCVGIPYGGGSWVVGGRSATHSPLPPGDWLWVQGGGPLPPWLFLLLPLAAASLRCRLCCARGRALSPPRGSGPGAVSLGTDTWFGGALPRKGEVLGGWGSPAGQRGGE